MPKERKPVEKTEKCPDCGSMFAPQGIALHRIKKHAATLSSTTPETVKDEPGAIPKSRAATTETRTPGEGPPRSTSLLDGEGGLFE